MRPRRAKRITVLMTLGWMAIGGVVGLFTTATARADVATDYAVEHAGETCGGLQRFPSVPGLIGSFVAAQQNGLTSDESARAVTYAVMDVCPQHLPELERFIAIYTQKGDGQ